MNNGARRIGIVFPPGNVAFEREAPRYMPEGVVSHYNRLSRPGSALTQESLIAMNDSLDRAVYDLAQAYPEVIIYGCTVGSFLEGAGRETDVAKKITASTGIQAVTTTTAVLEALTALNINKVFLITPYPRTLHDHEIEFLSQKGFTVVGSATFGCSTSEEIRRLSSADVGRLIMENREKLAGADGVFVSCATLMTMDCILPLEEELRIPVISSVQASFWAALKRIGVPNMPSAGILFKC
jgi:maleate isomerase